MVSSWARIEQGENFSTIDLITENKEMVSEAGNSLIEDNDNILKAEEISTNQEEIKQKKQEPSFPINSLEKSNSVFTLPEKNFLVSKENNLKKK